MRPPSRIVTAPAAAAVTLAEAKMQSSVTFADDDTLIENIYIKSATKSCEQVLQRKLITQTWKMFLDSWPGYIEVLFGDLQSVTHIKYTDLDGVQATFSNTKYDVDTISVPGRIFLKNGESWPSDTLNAVNPIEIQFVTGYGATAASIPEDIRHAILLTADHAYENRGNYILGTALAISQVPESAAAKLSNHRVWRWIL